MTGNDGMCGVQTSTEFKERDLVLGCFPPEEDSHRATPHDSSRLITDHSTDQIRWLRQPNAVFTGVLQPSNKLILSLEIYYDFASA